MKKFAQHRRSVWRRCYFAVRQFFRSIRRSYDYAVFGWGNYDWDYNYLIKLIRFKLERMHKRLNAEYETDKHIRSLRVALKLARRLEKEEYTKAHDQHVRRWGEANWWDMRSATPEERSSGIAQIWTPKTVTPELEANRASYEKAIRDDDLAQERDQRWLFAIMDKYCKHWWT